jgi:hypothetical protein
LGRWRWQSSISRSRPAEAYPRNRDSPFTGVDASVHMHRHKRTRCMRESGTSAASGRVRATVCARDRVVRFAACRPRVCARVVPHGRWICLVKHSAHHGWADVRSAVRERALPGRTRTHSPTHALVARTHSLTHGLPNALTRLAVVFRVARQAGAARTPACRASCNGHWASPAIPPARGRCR